PPNPLPYNWSALGCWHTNSNRLVGTPLEARTFVGALPAGRRSAPARHIALRSSAPHRGETGSLRAWRGPRQSAHRVGRSIDKVRERALQHWPTTRMFV